MPTAIQLPETVIVHPLVLLSVVDHYNRVALNTRKRVVGVLLGQNNGRVVNVANSFAVPFEEDEKDPSIWFLDHNYLESMFVMFKKVNASEKIVGWYHSGPKLRSSDLQINELIKRYSPNPTLVVINPLPRDIGLPTDAYMSVQEIHDDGTATTTTFNHINSEIQAEEAEEIGVEHMLRNVKDIAVGTLSTQVTTQLAAVKGLQQRIDEIHSYLGKVVAGELPINHPIIYNLQSIFNLLPNLQLDKVISAFSVKTNDQLLVVYVSSLIRSIVALHNLIDNKLENKQAEAAEADKENASKTATVKADSKTVDSAATKASTDSAATKK